MRLDIDGQRAIERDEDREREGEGVDRDAGAREMSPALRHMIAELRAEAPPEPSWDAVERKLLARIARGEGGSVTRNGGSALRMLAPLCAAAAAIAMAVTMGAGSGAPIASEPAAVRVVDASLVAQAPGTAGDRGDRDLSALHEGDAIESRGAPVTFARAGVVRWTLAAESRAVIRSAGAKSGVGMIVALERGSIRAEVVPRDPAEGFIDAFVIEAEGTRVAVHGTAFTVTRDGQRLVVDVEHGVVAVGPAGHRGATTGYSLVGPSRASFSLDGGVTARLLPRDEPSPAQNAVAALEPAPMPEKPAAPEPRAEPRAERPIERAEASPEPPPRGAPVASAAAPRASAHSEIESAPSPAPTAPEVKTESPAPAAPEKPVVFLTASSVKSRIERCIKDAQSERSTSMKVSIASTLTINVDPDGSVRSAKLNPPLAPHLANCAGLGISGKFASGPQTLTISLNVVEE